MIIFIQNLDNLREKIKGIDHSIIELISQRVNVALQIGEYKKENNLPVRNYQVEKQVIERIEKYSEEFQLDRFFTKDLFKEIISQSVKVQLSNRINTSSTSLKYNILVIGGEGEMGKWFVKFLRSSGHDVEISDPKIKTIKEGYKDLPDQLNNYDYMFVCVPLHKMRLVLFDLINRKSKAAIFEIASLKSSIIDLMVIAKQKGVNIYSIHPMFGPNVTDLSDRNLIVCTGHENDEMIFSEVEKFFKDTMVNIHSLHIKNHDKQMLYSLGLAHFINLLNGIILSNSNLDFDFLEKFAGTTFTKQIITTKEVFNENPSLYYNIQNINSYQNELFHQIRETTDKLITIINDKEETKFLDLMMKGSKYLEGDV